MAVDADGIAKTPTARATATATTNIAAGLRVMGHGL